MIHHLPLSDEDVGLIILALAACAAVSPENKRPLFHELATKIGILRNADRNPTQ